MLLSQCSGTAFSAAADAALNTTLDPQFTPYLGQVTRVDAHICRSDCWRCNA